MRYHSGSMSAAQPTALRHPWAALLHVVPCQAILLLTLIAGGQQITKRSYYMRCRTSNEQRSCLFALQAFAVTQWTVSPEHRFTMLAWLAKLKSGHHWARAHALLLVCTA